MRQHVARGGLCYEPFAGSGSQIVAGESVRQHAPKSVIVVDVAKVYHQALAAIPAPRKAA